MCVRKKEEHPAMLIRDRSIARWLIKYHFGRTLNPKQKKILNRIYGKENVKEWRETIRGLMRKKKLNDAQREELIETYFLFTDHYDYSPREKTIARNHGIMWRDSLRFEKLSETRSREATREF